MTRRAFHRAIFNKHIPGNPDIVVQNMAGAGSLIAANHLYTVAKPDGLTIASIIPALYFNQLAGRKEVRFDWSKFVWIGSPDRSDNLLYMRADTPFKTIDDVRGAAAPPKCTATGTGTTGHYMPKLSGGNHRHQIRHHSRLSGGPEMDLAVERNEAQCRALTIAAWFGGELYRTWRAKGFTNVLSANGEKSGMPRLPHVPLVNELMDEFKTPERPRRLATVVFASGELGAPLSCSSGNPSRAGLNFTPGAYEDDERASFCRRGQKKKSRGRTDDRRRTGKNRQRSYRSTARGHRKNEELFGKMTCEIGSLPELVACG